MNDKTHLIIKKMLHRRDGCSPSEERYRGFVEDLFDGEEELDNEAFLNRLADRAASWGQMDIVVACEEVLG